MRQLKLFGWLLATGVLLLFSCVKEIETPTEPLNLDPHHITVEQAVRTMESTILELYGGTRAPREYTIETLKGSDLQKTTARLGTRTMNDTPLPEDVLYVANFSNNSGFAVLAADNRIPPVLAITESGSLNVDDIQVHNDTDIERLTSTQLMGGLMADYVSNQLTLANDSYVFTDLTFPPSYALPTYKESWHKIKWHQGYPFNRQCFTADGKLAAVGCTPLAIAQVIAYYRYPELSFFTGNNNGTWESLIIGGYGAKYENITEADQRNYDNIAAFLSAVAHGTPEIEFGEKKTGAFVHWYIPYLQQLGYSVCRQEPPMIIYEDGISKRKDDRWFPYASVRKALKEDKPVVIDAESTRPEDEDTDGPIPIGIAKPSKDPHTFVMDRLYTASSIKIPSISQILLGRGDYAVEIDMEYVHCMWGWEYGYANGYYFFGVFNNMTSQPIDGSSILLDPLEGPITGGISTANHYAFNINFDAYIITPPNI